MSPLVDINRRELPKQIPTNNVAISYELNAHGKKQEVTFSTTVTYVNGLKYPIYITDRMGLTKTLPSGINKVVNSTCDLEIYLTHKYKYGVNFDPYSILDDKYVANNKTLALLKSEIIKHYDKLTPRQMASGEFSVTLKFVVTDELLRLNGNDVYLNDLDVAVKSAIANDDDLIPTHPESIEGRLLRELKQTTGFNLNVFINDPDSKFGERFVNILGQVYRVPMVQDRSKAEGVHFLESTPTELERVGSPVRKRVIAFDDAAVLEQFYPSQHSAKVLGDSNSAMKRQLDEYKNELAQAALDRERIASDLKFEREQAEDKRKKLKADQEAEADELKRMREEKEAIRKEIFADSDYRRKTYVHQMDDEVSIRQRIIAEDKYRQDRAKSESNAVLDILKWVPAAIGAVATMFIAFTKLLPSN